MKSVVMIAYFFPPEGSAGTYRSLRFVRGLAKIEWLPLVICADRNSYERYDSALLLQIPPSVEVVRVRASDPWQAIQSWRGKQIQEKCSTSSGKTSEKIQAAYHAPFRSRLRDAVRTIEAMYYYPDVARPWIRPAIRAALDICVRKRPHVLWATAGPVSAWIVAKQVSERTNIPYVLDLRDPHGLGYYESETKWPVWIRRRVYRSMHEALRSARAVVFLFDSVAQSYLRAFPGALNPERVHVISNGYEGEIEETAPPRADRCSILYTGTVSTYRYDTLLQALALFKSQHPEQAKQLLFRFVGEGADVVAKHAASLGLSDSIEISAPVSQNKIAHLQRQADALLLLGRSQTIKGHELVAGAKLFEYLKVRRPILAVLPEDEGRKILSKIGAPTVAGVNSTRQILAVLREVSDAWFKGTMQTLLPRRNAIEAYSIEHQTVSLVRALEGQPAAASFVPDLNQVPPSLKESLSTKWISDCLHV